MEGPPNPNPRKIHISNLRQLVSKICRDRHDLILMGDFNEQIGLDPQGMSSVLTTGGLIDSHTTHHGIKNEPATYARGHTRLDYIYISERLKPCLLWAGIKPFNQCIFSDHCGMFIDLSLPGLFDRALTMLAFPANHHLCSTNPQHVQNYIRGLYAYLQQHLVATATSRGTQIQSQP
jgi:hypothetical protein